jgi:hypothetical protein
MGRRTERNRRALHSVDVQAAYSYVDSVGFQVNRRLPDDLFEEVLKSLHHAHGWFKKPVLEKVRVPGWDGFQLYFWLHQPTRRSIRLLDQYEGARFYGVDVALDLCVQSPNAAEKLEGYVLRHIHKEPKVPKLPSWRLGDKTHIGHTYFWEFEDPNSKEILVRPGRRDSQIVVYSDRESKVTRGRCVHIEYRVAGKRWLENDRFISPADILSLRHRDFWAKRLHLLEPPSGDRLERVAAEVIGKRRAAGTKNRSWETRISDAKGALTGAFKDSSGPYPLAHGTDVAYVLDKSGLAGKDSPMRLFDSTVSFTWALPTVNRNALWELADRVSVPNRVDGGRNRVGDVQD